MDPYFSNFWPFEDSLRVWLSNNLLTIETLIQVAIILIAFITARLFSKYITAWVEKKFKDRTTRGTLRLYASYSALFFYALFSLLLWLAVLITQTAGLNLPWLNILASLALAWAVIRFTSSTIESSFWSNIVAITLWSVAALNILGLLEPTINLMDKAALAIGKVKISLLMVIKGLLAFALLIWIIRFISRMLERFFARAGGLNPSQRVLYFKLSNILLYVAAGVIGLNIIGLDLTALAVFSGALGLGIGFGLQKVFSNLISGIILLMDKSIKPGDVIAINNTYGWVNSLGARYVSILTRDGKEHLIPNENLITNNVENWSYSDSNIRVHIPIRVSYNSDINLVKKILLQAVADHPRVLKNPSPSCLLTGFGDSSVEFQMRCWIADPQEGITNLISDIYYKIWDLFKERKIEIPFPQRDVHIKTTPAEYKTS